MTHLLDPVFIISTLGLLGVFAIIFIESGVFFGFFFPGDSLLFTAGLLASENFFSFPVLVLGCALSAFLGGLVGYFFGVRVGPAIFSREDSFFFHKKHLLNAQAYYSAHGKMTIVLARFLPIVRTFAPILAGVGKMNRRTFMLFNFFGAVLWSLLLTGIGYFLGRVIPDAERYILPFVLIIIVASFLPPLLGLRKWRTGA